MKEKKQRINDLRITAERFFSLVLSLNEASWLFSFVKERWASTKLTAFMAGPTGSVERPPFLRSSLLWARASLLRDGRKLKMGSTLDRKEVLFHWSITCQQLQMKEIQSSADYSLTGNQKGNRASQWSAEEDWIWFSFDSWCWQVIQAELKKGFSWPSMVDLPTADSLSTIDNGHESTFFPPLRLLSLIVSF